MSEINAVALEPNTPSSPDPAVTEPAAPTARRPSLIPSPRALRIARRIVLRATAGMAGVLFLAMLGLAVGRAAYQDRVYPGVIVGNVEIGGLSKADAQFALDQRMAAINSGFVVFSYDGRSWSPTLQDLGVFIDTEASLETAYAIGREDSAGSRLSSLGSLARGDTGTPLVMYIDETRLSAWFDRVDADISQLPREARLVVTPSGATIEPEQTGIAVDRAAARQLLIDSLNGLNQLNADLPTIVTPAKLTADMLTPVAERIDEALSKPVPVRFERTLWQIPASDLSGFVVLVTDPETGEFHAELDRVVLSTWLGQMFGDQVNRDARDAELGWNDGLKVLRASVDGVKLRPSSFAEALEKSMFGDHTEIEIPVNITQPKVDSDNIAALNITTFLGSGDSNFDGSTEGRAINVAVGASLLNGTLIPPGEIFSFNHSIGEITEDKGYVEAGVIDGERVGRDIGGGICQVSTTVFRAAFYSGLPLIEAWPHRYRLAFYEQDGWPPGLDASILQPEGDPFSGGDFRFLNPSSEGWLLIQAWTDATRVTVAIYGPDLGYTVNIDGPMKSKPIPPTDDLEIVDEELPPGTIELSEMRQEGLETRYVRTVTDRSGEIVLSDDYYTKFESRGDVYKVSPDMKGESPAGKKNG